MIVKDRHWRMEPNKQLSIQLAKRQLSELVFDAVNLEGVNMTLPEIQTLLEGVTVGGHKVSDQQMALNQAETWKTLFNMVESGKWSLSQETALKLHNIAGKDEALTWGTFRNQNVTIGGTEYMPPDHSELSGLFDKMVTESNRLDDIYEKAFYVFLNMARNQYFFDVNKRMGRYMMNGVLLNAGYPAVNVQAKRKLEFNQKMIEFYDTNDMKSMQSFLRSCVDQRVIKIIKDSSNSLSM